MKKIKLSKRKQEELTAFKELKKDPSKYLKKVFGTDVIEHQRPILESCLNPNTPLTTVATCHAVGKSTTGAMAAVTMLLTHQNSVIIIVANNLKQAKNGVFKEVRKLLKKCKIGIKFDKTQTEIRIGDSAEWKIMISSSDPHSDSAAQGIHGDKMLIIIDEGAGIHDNIFAQLDACLTGVGNEGIINNMLILGNPTNSTGQFYKKYMSELSNSIQLSAFDTPNLKRFNITIEDFRNNTWKQKIGKEKVPYKFLISPAWAYKKFVEEGEDSHYFKTRILAEFQVGNSVGLFTGKMIGEATSQADCALKGNLRMGFDVSGTESGDKSILAVIQDNGLKEFHVIRSIKPSEQVADVYAIIQNYQEQGYKVEYCNIDADGMGVMVYNETKDNYPKDLFQAFKGGTPSLLMDSDGNKQYGNQRSEGYAVLASLLRQVKFYLPEHELLEQDLFATDLDTTKSLISLVRKEHIKKKLKGRSPDHADALMMALVELRDKSEMDLVERWRLLAS